MTVFVIETGEYEQRGIAALAATLESGVAKIKADYPSLNHWSELEQDGECYELRGHTCPSKYRDEQFFTLTPHEVV